VFQKKKRTSDIPSSYLVLVTYLTMSKKSKEDRKYKLPSNIATYVINCDKHKERLREFKTMAKRLHFGGIKRIRCANGSNMSHDEVCWISKSGWLLPDNRVNKIEFSICLSHFRAWQAFLSTKKKYALIFEDDVKHVNDQFVPRLRIVLKELEKRHNKFDAIWLYDGDWMRNQRERSRLFSFTQHHEDIIVYEHLRDHNPGANCYLITRDFAEHLSQTLFPLKYPVDIFMGDQVIVRPGNPQITFGLHVNPHKCISSPFVWMDCGGEHGTGESTQDYSLPKLSKMIKQCSLDPHPSGSDLTETIKKASNVMKKE